MYALTRLTRKNKKLMITTPESRKMHFGSALHSDFTMHHDEERKERYIKRHAIKEDWTFKGINTAGFFSRYLLWNEKTLKQSIKNVKKYV